MLNNEEQSRNEDSDGFNRLFKCAVIVYAIIEFIVIAFAIYYKISR
jgi:large-conductance mechanosensitive channel